MNEQALYTKVGGIVNRFAATMGEDSMYHQQEEARAYRASNPSACVVPGLSLARLNARTQEIVQQLAKDFSCRGDRLADLIQAAQDIADHADAGMPPHTPREDLEFRAAVDRISDCAGRYLEAETAWAAKDAAMDCAKALEVFGKVLITKYGTAADISNTQLRILRTWLLATLTQPVAFKPDRARSGNETIAILGTARATCCCLS